MMPAINILLIEDNPDHQALFEATLQTTSYSHAQLKIAGTLSQGQQMLQAPGFDIVFLDLSLPDSSFKETLEQIESLSTHCPIVVLTALDDNDTIFNIINQGADDCLPKSDLSCSHLSRSIKYSMDRWLLKQQLQHSQQQYQSLVEHLPEIIYRCNLNQTRIVQYLNPAVEKLLGYTPEQLINHPEQTLDDRIHPDDREMVRDAIERCISSDANFQLEYRMISAQGDTLWVKDTGLSINHTDPPLLEGVISDITLQKHAYQYLQKVVDTQDNMIVLTDGFNLIFGNKTFIHFFGLENIQQFQQKYQSLPALFIKSRDCFHLTDEQLHSRHWIDMLQQLPDQQRIVKLRDKLGVHHSFLLNISYFDAGNYLFSFSDISATIAEKKNLEHKVMHDKLTGAYTREYFEEQILNNIHKFHATGHLAAFVMIDIDHFKRVNDTYGHQTGDQVLQQVVMILDQNIRSSDKLIRWGGEEFLLVLSVRTCESAEKIAELLRHTIEIEAIDPVPELTCSFGLALHCPPEAVTHTIKRADQALYQAKKNGRNQVITAPQP